MARAARSRRPTGSIRPALDQRTLYEGNSILRGGREPRVEEPQAQRAVEALVIE